MTTAPYEVIGDSCRCRPPRHALENERRPLISSQLVIKLFTLHGFKIMVMREMHPGDLSCSAVGRVLHKILPDHAARIRQPVQEGSGLRQQQQSCRLNRMRCQDKDSGGALVLNPIGGCIDRPVDAPRRINLKPEDIRQGKHSHIASGLGELDV